MERIFGWVRAQNLDIAVSQWKVAELTRRPEDDGQRDELLVSRTFPTPSHVTHTQLRCARCAGILSSAGDLDLGDTDCQQLLDCSLRARCGCCSVRRHCPDTYLHKPGDSRTLDSTSPCLSPSLPPSLLHVECDVAATGLLIPGWCALRLLEDWALFLSHVCGLLNEQYPRLPQSQGNDQGDAVGLSRFASALSASFPLFLSLSLSLSLSVSLSVSLSFSLACLPKCLCFSVHSLGLRARENEFAGLLLLFFACCGGTRDPKESASEITTKLRTMPRQQLHCQEVRYSLRVWEAVRACDYGTYFSPALWKAASWLQRPFLQVCVNARARTRLAILLLLVVF